MYAYEELANKHPHINITYKKMPQNLAGLCFYNDIYLSDSISDVKKYETLQEELAHYEITVGDIVKDENSVDSRKQEYKARSLAMTRTVTLDDLIYCRFHGIWETEDIADYCNVDVEYLTKAIDNYRIKRGPIFRYKNYEFDLRNNVKIEKIDES